MRHPNDTLDGLQSHLEDESTAPKLASQAENGGYSRHRLSSMFPDLKPEEHCALAESVKRDGLLEAIWLYEGEILDGWHRYQACLEVGVEPRFREYEGDAPASFVLSQQQARRNWSSSQAAAVADALEPDLAEEARRRMKTGKDVSGQSGGRGKIRNPRQSIDEGLSSAGACPATLGRDHQREKAGRSDEQAAKAVGTNRTHLRNFRDIKSQDPELAGKIRTGEMDIPRAKRILRERDAAEKRRTERIKNASASHHQPQLHLADFRKVELEPSSVDAIITDPPYPREYLPLYRDLAEYAAKVLKPGGIVLAMAGQSYLPDVHRMMSEHLNYIWTLCYATPGASTAVWQRKARSNWKPVLLYSKGDYIGDNYLDHLISGGTEKEHHEWGQNEDAFATLVQRFTKTDDLVLDPFLGGGTTGMAAIAAKRQFIGIEFDQEKFSEAKRRLAGLDAGGSS